MASHNIDNNGVGGGEGERAQTGSGKSERQKWTAGRGGIYSNEDSRVTGREGGGREDTGGDR